MKSSGVGTNDTSRSSGINDETTIADELNDLSFDSQTSKQQGSRKQAVHHSYHIILVVMRTFR